MPVQHTASGAGAPTSAPPSLSAHYLDTSTGDQYMAKGTASVSDWVKVGGEKPLSAVVWEGKAHPTADIDFAGVVYNAALENLKFVAVAGKTSIYASGGDPYWNSFTTSETDTLWSQVASGPAGVMVASADCTKVAYSTTGTTWTVYTTPVPAGSSGMLVYNPVLVLFMLYVQGPTGTDVYSSDDGYTWVQETLTLPADNILGFSGKVSGKDQFVGAVINLATMEAHSAVSDDGLTWTTVGAPLVDGVGVITHAAYSPALGRYLVSRTGINTLQYSDDGLATLNDIPEQDSGVQLGGSGVYFLPERNLFYTSTGPLGTWDTQLTLSRDGLSFTPVILPQMVEMAYPTGFVWDAGAKCLIIVCHQSMTRYARIL